MLLLLLAAQATTPATHFWGRFSRAPVLAHRQETVEIASDGSDGGTLRYKLRLTRTRLGKVEEVLWASSLTCPAVRPLLESLPALPVPSIRPFGVGAPQDLEIVLDGTGYALHMPVMFGRQMGEVDLTSNVGTPLAAWVDGALTRLAPCWSAVELRAR